MKLRIKHCSPILLKTAVPCLCFYPQLKRITSLRSRFGIPCSLIIVGRVGMTYLPPFYYVWISQWLLASLLGVPGPEVPLEWLEVYELVRAELAVVVPYGRVLGLGVAGKRWVAGEATAAKGALEWLHAVVIAAHVSVHVAFNGVRGRASGKLTLVFM